MASIQTAIQIQNSLASIGSPPVEEEESQVKGEETDSLVTGVEKSWLYMAALIAIISAACSMLLTASVVVDFASVTILVLAPIAIVQKQKLNELGTMRAQQNELRQSINDLSSENNQLSQSISQMETALQELKTVEQELEQVAQRTGGQVDRLVTIIQENASLQAKIKKSLEAEVLQNVLQIALASDKNMDFSFSKPELDRLQLRLASIPGITFDAANFEQKIGTKALTLRDLMAMFRNLKSDIPEEENIFHITPKEIVKTSKRGFFG